jgi:hypothetical protein
VTKVSDAGKKVHLKYVESFEDRHGRWRWYYRRKDGTRHAMPDPLNPLAPCSKFMALYEKLVAEREKEKPKHGRDHSCIVYFALKGRYIKIGYTTNPRSRIASLQTATHGRVFFYYMTPGGRTLERELHEKFKHLRAKGEWFLYGKEIKDWIKEDEAQRRREVQAEIDHRRNKRYGLLSNHPSEAA